MSSGIYAALSGAVARMQAVETVSNNLTNANTHGFKKERLSFSALLDGANQAQRSGGVNFAYVGNSKTDFKQGVVVDTKNDLDVAINGDGLFKIRNEDGLFYTRVGAFDRSPDGTLVTRTGYEVLSDQGKSITLPEGPISIDEWGNILGIEGEVARIGVFVPKLALLTKVGQGHYSYGGNEQTVAKSEDSQLMQGQLEQSNVKAMEETAIMMTSLRAFESYQKAMKNFYTIDGKVDEIGSLN